MCGFSLVCFAGLVLLAILGVVLDVADVVVVLPLPRKAKYMEENSAGQLLAERPKDVAVHLPWLRMASKGHSHAEG